MCVSRCLHAVVRWLYPFWKCGKHGRWPQCSAKHPVAPDSYFYCILPRGHIGKHRDESGSWGTGTVHDLEMYESIL